MRKIDKTEMFVTFMHPEAAWRGDQERVANLGFVVGRFYEVESILVGRSSTDVYLVGYDDTRFNSVHFDFYEQFDPTQNDRYFTYTDRNHLTTN